MRIREPGYLGVRAPPAVQKGREVTQHLEASVLRSLGLRIVTQPTIPPSAASEFDPDSPDVPVNQALFFPWFAYGRAGEPALAVPGSTRARPPLPLARTTTLDICFGPSASVSATAGLHDDNPMCRSRSTPKTGV
jgi:hypothetical protein